MTNEKKALSLAGLKYIDDVERYYNRPKCEIYDKCLEAMKWKDKQIDTILLTMKGCLGSFFESRGNSEESINNFIKAIELQIDKNLNEL